MQSIFKPFIVHCEKLRTSCLSVISGCNSEKCSDADNADSRQRMFWPEIVPHSEFPSEQLYLKALISQFCRGSDDFPANVIVDVIGILLKLESSSFLLRPIVVCMRMWVCGRPCVRYELM